VHSSQGDGVSRLLALTVSPEKYLQVSGGATFTPPTKPSDSLGLANNASATAVALATRAKDKAKEEWITYTLTLKALRQQLLQAMPHRWISELADDKTDFAGVPPIAILTILWEKHGKISQTMLANNLLSLSQEWCPTDPMENYWEHVKKCTDFAARGKEPIHQDVVLRAVLGTLEATGEFTLDIRDWKKLPEKEKTVINIQTFFEEANVTRLQTATTATKGYACRAEQERLKHNKRKFEPPPTGQQMQYCWSHGLNKTHSSAACKYPFKNHNKKATAGRMFGGCNVINRPKKEVVIWQPRPPRAGPGSENNQENE
jgi:hypothetical protein